MVPIGLCQMRFLSQLALSDNNLYGLVPSCFGQLSKLGLRIVANIATCHDPMFKELE